MQENNYKVRLDVFEGPMDLLVYLIKKAEVDIYDIPIALITEQFIAYIEWMKSMNIDLAGDFLVMAATLAQIKSKMLLPDHDSDEDEEEDPRMEIARPLAEYLSISSAASRLSERDMLGKDTFAGQPKREDFLVDNDDRMIKVGLFELIDAFQSILEKVSGDHTIDLTADRISVKDRISEIADILEENGSVTFNELFKDHITKNDLIVTFLAILEMAKIALIRIAQHVQTGIIRVFYL
ncbi:MAG: segregation/condensation protein A [Deltaproteobacteria bacterium]|nr:segregation/condensation protein A [Deltaproteobacteria bacterium]MBW2219854.1 segregation/condensation protein A [Deltaproteobacteria bacterium]